MTKKTWKTLTYVVALLIRGCLVNCRLQICGIPACEVIGHLISLSKKHLVYITANVPQQRFVVWSVLTVCISKRQDDQAVLVVDGIDQAS